MGKFHVFSKVCWKHYICMGPLPVVLLYQGSSGSWLPLIRFLCINGLRPQRVCGVVIMVCHGVCVAALPESPPVIHTEHDRYEPGDTLRANCTSPPSKPAANLSFFVNNIPVSRVSFKIHTTS